jgi:hypothetical protein
MGNKRKPTLESEAAKHGPAYLAKWKKLHRCSNCGRVMRPSNGKAADYPATTSYGTGLMCVSCKQNPTPEETTPMRAPGTVSVSAALRQQDGRAQKIRPRSIEARWRGPAAPKTRQQIAELWSPEQRSVALLACEYVPREELDDVLGSLGLFDDPDLQPVLNLPLERVGRTPKGPSGSFFD